MISLEDYEDLNAAFERDEISEAILTLVAQLCLHYLPPKGATPLTLAYSFNAYVASLTKEDATSLVSFIVARRKSRWFPTIGDVLSYRKDMMTVGHSSKAWVASRWPHLSTLPLERALCMAYEVGAVFGGTGDSVLREDVERIGKCLIARAREGRE